jgi:hypothetical protein
MGQLTADSKTNFKNYKCHKLSNFSFKETSKNGFNNSSIFYKFYAYFEDELRETSWSV